MKLAPIIRREGPKLGHKQIFLPNFVLTLLRTPQLPPTFASFIVPLNLNKLDLRDYLYNAYGLNVRGVRSYIQMQKLRQDKVGAKRPSPRRWFRPRSIKKMMVEMERPFLWPEVPKDLDAWDKKTFDKAQEDRRRQEEAVRPEARANPSRERGAMAEQAKALLQGNCRWKKTSKDEEWEDVGDMVEVEQDVEVPTLQRRRDE